MKKSTGYRVIVVTKTTDGWSKDREIAITTKREYIEAIEKEYEEAHTKSNSWWMGYEVNRETDGMVFKVEECVVYTD